MDSKRNRNKFGMPYFLAALAGMVTGWVDVTVNDLLLTALLVLMACMALGIARPHRPWRWVVIVEIFIPLTELAAFVILTVKPSRGQMWGSFLAFLPGIAGAYGGSVVRGVVDNLRQGKSLRLPALGVGFGNQGQISNLNRKPHCGSRTPLL